MTSQHAYAKVKPMKQRSTTPVSKSFTLKASLIAAAILMAVAAPIQMGTVVRADRYDEQIAAIRQEIAQYQNRAAELQQQANTLQNEVNRLSAEKATIQAQLDLSQAQYDQLVAQIKETEEKIAANKDALGEILATLYVDDNISPLEMLASSKNIADYVDKQEYRSAIRDELTSTIAEIKDLKIQLEKKQVEVKLVLDNQKTQRDALAAKEAEQQGLLNATRGEEAAYQRLSSEKNAQINALRAQQAAEIRARASSGGGYTTLPGDPNRGGYPAAWANAPMNAYVDNWGMYTRQCVSYTAFKVQQAYGNMPYWGGRGNANQWGNNARAAGIRVSVAPAPGTVGVLYDGPYGHVGWVEEVHGDGTITISHYNAGWTGEYSRWRVSSSFFQEYIYFGG